MAADIHLEEQKKALVALSSANDREEADVRAYALAQMVKSIGGTDPKILQTLASVGMDPSRLMAAAFRDIADNADKIGHLNISPDLLRELIEPAPKKG